MVLRGRRLRQDMMITTRLLSAFATFSTLPAFSVFVPTRAVRCCTRLASRCRALSSFFLSSLLALSWLGIVLILFVVPSPTSAILLRVSMSRRLISKQIGGKILCCIVPVITAHAWGVIIFRIFSRLCQAGRRVLFSLPFSILVVVFVSFPPFSVLSLRSALFFAFAVSYPNTHSIGWELYLLFPIFTPLLANAVLFGRVYASQRLLFDHPLVEQRVARLQLELAGEVVPVKPHSSVVQCVASLCWRTVIDMADKGIRQDKEGVAARR
mmetsp:Transcript_20469/g.52565  ORF Transcript_20469/g.52565 Transcript_20469/m.52565 type:complete len:268 (+) Transcript_20469:436-1239(+)